MTFTRANTITTVTGQSNQYRQSSATFYAFIVLDKTVRSVSHQYPSPIPPFIMTTVQLPARKRASLDRNLYRTDRNSNSTGQQLRTYDRQTTGFAVIRRSESPKLSQRLSGQYATHSDSAIQSPIEIGSADNNRNTNPATLDRLHPIAIDKQAGQPANTIVHGVAQTKLISANLNGIRTISQPAIRPEIVHGRQTTRGNIAISRTKPNRPEIFVSGRTTDGSDKRSGHVEPASTDSVGTLVAKIKELTTNGIVDRQTMLTALNDLARIVVTQKSLHVDRDLQAMTVRTDPTGHDAPLRNVHTAIPSIDSTKQALAARKSSEGLRLGLHRNLQSITLPYNPTGRGAFVTINAVNVPPKNGSIRTDAFADEGQKQIVPFSKVDELSKARNVTRKLHLAAGDSWTPQQEFTADLDSAALNYNTLPPGRISTSIF